MSDEHSPMIDLDPQALAQVKALLQRHLPGVEVWAYGSRVQGRAKPWSDLDLVAFVPPAQRDQVALLKEAFEESDLPFRVDLFTWDEIPESFRRTIAMQHQILQARREQRSSPAPTGT